ncbi:MAG: hypothetical protein ACPL88_03080, partial [Bryobacteraceae bacterium]
MLRDVWYILAGGTLTVGWMLAWFVPSWLGLPALDRWVLRGGLAVLVLLGALALLWVGRRKRAAAASQAGAIEGAADELDVLIREAERRLAAARGRSVSVENLPVVLLVGEAGSAKTSSMVHSGLDPELLAGQVYQETAIVPTRAVNIWLAGQTLFIEAGGKLLADVP